MKKGDPSSYLVKGTEWFARLAVLNLLWLLFSVPIVTIIPATCALFSVLAKWTRENEKLPAYRTFKDAFFNEFVESYKIGWLFIVVGVILLVNLFFFQIQDLSNNWFYILKYANYLLAVLYFILFGYSFSLKQLVPFKPIQLIAGAFVLAISPPILTLLILLGTGMLAGIFLYMPALLFFFSTSLPGLAFTFASKKGYERLMKKVEENRKS